MRATARPAPRRAVAVLLGLMVVGLAQLWAATVAPARSPSGTVTVTPQKAAPGGALTLSGWCARVLQPDGSLGPPAATTAVALGTTALVTVPVDQGSGNWGPVTVPVPTGTTAGDHTIRTECGGAGTFTVIAAPAAPRLTVTPDRAAPPVAVTVGGTCAPGTTSVQLFLDGTAAEPLDINQATGEIQAITFHLGAGTPPGAHRFTTSCGGAATFTAVAVAVPGPASGTTSAHVPSTSAAPPSTQLVRVPDLSGLTEEQAVTALGDRLHLARTTGDTGRIRSQRPAAGSMVPAGSAVDVTFGAAAAVPASGSGVLWVVIGAAAGLLALGATAWLLLRRGRRGGPPGRGGPGTPFGPAPGPVSQDRTLVGPPGR